MPSFLATARSNKLPSAQIGNVIAETQYNGSDNLLLVCPLEGSQTLNNRRFTVRIGGTCGSNGATNLTIKVYFGISATIASNTALASTGAVAMASANHNFWLDILMQYDTISNKIQGYFIGQIAGTVVSETTLSAIPTSVSDVAEGQGFTVTALFGTTQTGNVSIVQTF